MNPNHPMLPGNTGPYDQVYIVIAAYNEAKTIGEVVERLLPRFPNIVVVDDGSSDKTWSVLSGFSVIRLRHCINRGQGAALQTGIKFALDRGVQAVVTFDADGQHDSNDIPAILEPILSGEYDFALGSRFLGQAHNIPLTRRWLLKAGILFTRVVSGIQVTDVHNGFRGFSRRGAQNISIYIDRMGHASEILEQIKLSGLRFVEVPVNVYYSSYSLRKGQSSWNALRIALQFLIEKLSPR